MGAANGRALRRAVRSRLRGAGAAWAVAAALTLAGAVAGAAPRAVAVTIDDLPASRAGSLEDVRGITRRLLAHLRAAAIPAVGFVNEVKLEVPGEESARAALLEAWLDAGH